jgi:hypothetical protein
MKPSKLAIRPYHPIFKCGNAASGYRGEHPRFDEPPVFGIDARQEFRG